MTTDVAEVTQTDADVTQAAEGTESSDLSEGLVLLSEETQTTAVQDTPADGTEPEAESVDEETEQYAQAQAKRVAEETRTKTLQEEHDRQESEKAEEETARRLAGIQQAFRTRATRLRSVLGLALSGETVEAQDGSVMSAEQVLNWALNEFEAHHGQIAPMAANDFRSSFFENAALLLPEDERPDFLAKSKNLKSMPDAFKDVNSRLEKEHRKGHLSESQVQEKEALAAVKVRRRYEKMLKEQGAEALISHLSRAVPAQSRAGTTTSGHEPRNLAEAEQMHAGMHASGRTITNAEMRAYTARFQQTRN